MEGGREGRRVGGLEGGRVGGREMWGRRVTMQMFLLHKYSLIACSSSAIFARINMYVNSRDTCVSVDVRKCKRTFLN